MAKKKENEEIAQLSFEQSIDRLGEIVSKIEQGKIPLAQSIDRYEQGMELIKHCRDLLKSAEQRIEKINKAQQKDENKPKPGQKKSGESEDSGDDELF